MVDRVRDLEQRLAELLTTEDKTSIPLYDRRDDYARAADFRDRLARAFDFDPAWTSG